MPAARAKTPLPIVANARHSPGHVRALRLDRLRFAAPFGNEQEPLGL